MRFSRKGRKTPGKRETWMNGKHSDEWDCCAYWYHLFMCMIGMISCEYRVCYPDLRAQNLKISTKKYAVMLHVAVPISL